MASRLTLQHVRDTKSLAAATAEFAIEAGRSMESFWLAILPEGQATPLTDEERILALGEFLEQTSELELATDALLTVTLRERRKRVAENNEAARVLHLKLVHLRGQIEGTYGPGQAFILLGLGPDLPEDSLGTAVVCRRLVDELSEPGFAFPEKVLRGQPAIPAAIVADLQPNLEILEATRDAVDPEKRTAQRALKHKRQAAEAHTLALGRVARYLEALFELCGETFLAERLRLSSHIAAAEARRRRAEQEADDDEAGKNEEESPEPPPEGEPSEPEGEPSEPDPEPAG